MSPNRPASAEHPKEMISAYLDGQLEAPDRERVFEHLSGCGACRQLLADFRALAAAARREGAPPVPADLAERIGRRIDAEPKARFTRRWRLVTGARLPLATAAAVLVLSSLWIVWRGRLPGEQPAVSETDSAPAPAPEPAPALRPATPQAPSPSPAPFAPSPPARSGSVGTEPEVARSLDNLGYVGGREDAGSREPVGRQEADRPSRLSRKFAVSPPPPAPLTSEAAPSGQAAPYSKKDVAPAGEKPDQEEKEAAAAPAQEGSAAGVLALAPGVAGGAVAPATAGSTLVFVMPEGRVSILPDSRIIIASGDYLCTLSAAGPEEDEALADLRAQAARRERPAGLAAAPSTVTSPVSAEPAPTGGPAAERGSPMAAPPGEIVVPAPPGRGPLAPDLAAELHRRVRILMRDRLLARAEAQCGPVPPALRRVAE